MYTWQQARAQIVRVAIHSYSRDELITRIKRLSPGARIAHNCSILSLAYKLAWQLLPAVDRSGHEAR
jgi:hypothetical protein